MVMEQVGEVGGALIMESFVGEQENFELHPLRNRKPLDLLKD